MFFSKDMGIDLGTANTLVYIKGKGIVLSEPSVVAIDNTNGKVLAVGQEAKEMLGRTPGNIVAVRPMKDGVIADFDITQAMIKYFINKVMENKIFFIKPRVIISIPTGCTTVEERAVREAALSAGAKEVLLLEEPMAAALGADLPVYEPVGSMIVDIGGGTTEVAVVSLGGIVTARSIRVAGDKMDEAIIQHLRRTYSLMVGERTAEDIKITIGSALWQGDEEHYEVRGRDLVTGLPKTVSISSREVEIALQEPTEEILEGVKICLEQTPPELAADIIDRGIILAGGGALMRGLDQLISRETFMPVCICEDPLRAVARGTGLALENIEKIRRILIPSRKSI